MSNLLDPTEDYESTLMNKVDSIVDQAIEDDNPFAVTKQMQVLIDARQLVGKALAKFLFRMETSWAEFSLSTQETYIDFMRSSLTISDNTRNTYPNYWKHRDKLPESFEERPLREIIPVTNAISQGYDVPKAVWKDLERATNQSEVSKIVREQIKKKPAKRGSQQGYVYPNGSIVSWKNDQRKEVGFLDLSNSDEDVQKLINRIINGAGLIRR